MDAQLLVSRVIARICQKRASALWMRQRAVQQDSQLTGHGLHWWACLQAPAGYKAFSSGFLTIAAEPGPDDGSATVLDAGRMIQSSTAAMVYA